MEDDIPPANPNTITQTDGEHSNACNTDPATCRIEGKFVWENVFNLSSRNITEDEIKVFKKGLGFVPKPVKINRWQLKNYLKKFGRNIRLWMHFASEVTPNFSESIFLNTVKLDSLYQRRLFRNVSHWNRGAINENQRTWYELLQFE